MQFGHGGELIARIWSVTWRRGVIFLVSTLMIGMPILADDSTPVPPGYSADNPITSNAQWTPEIITETVALTREIAQAPGGQSANVRSGPSTDAGVIAGLQPGDAAIVLGENPDGTWLEIRAPGGQTGWVFATVVTVAEIEISADIEMVLAPAGCFLMGSEKGESATIVSPQPVHEQCFSEPFWIDRMEVSNAQFEQLGGLAEERSAWSEDNLPREEIQWAEALDFCLLRGARLPTEAEWEYAARGPDNLEFPWGNDFDGTRVNFCDTNCDRDNWKDASVDDGYRYTAPVGTYESGASWVGALDLSGNVFEWMSSDLESYPYRADDGRETLAGINNRRVIRGGSFGNSADGLLRTWERGWGDPDHGQNITGFRCARDYSDP